MSLHVCFIVFLLVVVVVAAAAAAAAAAAVVVVVVVVVVSMHLVNIGFSLLNETMTLPAWARYPKKACSCLFCCFTSQSTAMVIGAVSSPSHTFSMASMNKRFTSSSCTYFCL